MHLMLKSLARLAVGGMVLAGAMSSHADLVDGSGFITGWGFTPFNNTGSFGTWNNGAPPLGTGVNGIDNGGAYGGAYTEGNNASPVDYPTGSPDYVPAPAGSAVDGEKWDMEFLGWRLVNGGTQIQVLGVTSTHPDLGAVRTTTGNTYHLGDVFLDVDGDATNGYNGYDYALVAGQWSTTLNDPLHPADDPYTHNMASELYAITGANDVHNTTNVGGFGLEPGIGELHNPFAVRNGAAQVASNMLYEEDTFDYGTIFGANEDGTWILQWTFDVAALGPNFDPYNLRLHWTVECANDLMETDPIVPEPATLGLIGMGLATFGAIRRRRRQA